MATPPAPDRWFFDGWSQFYDLAPVQWATYRPVHDAVLRALDVEPQGRVLDVGCGTGQFAARIQQERPDVGVVGCDFSEGMLQHARERLPAGSWIQGDAGRLPFQSSVFDAVVSTEAFHWFPDQPAALAEFRRVLRPGGTLLLALVNLPVQAMSAAFHLGSRLIGEPFYWPTSEELADTIESAGLRVVDQRRIFRIPGGLLLPPVLTHAKRPTGDVV